jgi:xanthine dehydrogenase accessory factor
MVSLAALLELSRGREAAALCTVTSTKGSTPRKAGAKMVVVADGTPQGRIEGTIGGGAVEHRVRETALECIRATRPREITFALTTELGMCCGGQMTLFIEPLRARPPLIVLGAGHVGCALATAGDLAGFDVTVCDPRADLCTAERFSKAALIDGYDDEDLTRAPFGPDAFVVVVTHDHQMDQSLVERCLRRETRYLAMIGSQRKASMMRERCRAKGIADDDIARVFSPAGLDIGAETPEEIALSIVAQMVHVRRREGAMPDAILAHRERA